MFFLSKCHMILVILCTWLSALFIDRSVPYFPIEISRTAASGPVAHSVFTWGSISLILSLLYDNCFIVARGDMFQLVFGNPIMLWPIVVSIAWFDDTRHFHLHNLGVTCMLGMIALHVFFAKDAQLKVPVYVSALCLVFMGAFIKGGAIVYMEMKEPLYDWRVPLRIASNTDGKMDEAVNSTLGIMYRGDASEFAHLLPIFQVTGMLQWLCFYLLASLY